MRSVTVFPKHTIDALVYSDPAPIDVDFSGSPSLRRRRRRRKPSLVHEGPRTSGSTATRLLVLTPSVSLLPLSLRVGWGLQKFVSRC